MKLVKPLRTKMKFLFLDLAKNQKVKKEQKVTRWFRFPKLYMFSRLRFFKEILFKIREKILEMAQKCHKLY